MGGGGGAQAGDGGGRGGGERYTYMGHDVGAERGSMTNRQGLRLATYTWRCRRGPPRGVVVAAHGLDVHAKFDMLKASEPGKPHVTNTGVAGALSGAHGPAAERPDFACCDVIGLDHQSYGESEGALGPKYRSFFWSFQDLVEDFAQLITQIRAEPRYEGLPVFLKGSSLGGGVCLAIAATRPELLDGFVLVAPLITLDRVKSQSWNPYLRPLAGLISRIYPTLPAGTKSPNPNRTQYEEFEVDEQTHKGMVRARVATEVLNYTDAVVELLPRVTAPFLVLHSPGDNMTEFAGSQMLMELAATPAELKRLDAIDGWHAVLHEKDGHKHIATIAEWVAERVAAHEAKGAQQ